MLHKNQIKHIRTVQEHLSNCVNLSYNSNDKEFFKGEQGGDIYDIILKSKKGL